jgi:hypothetical protein
MLALAIGPEGAVVELLGRSHAATASKESARKKKRALFRIANTILHITNEP